MSIVFAISLGKHFRSKPFRTYEKVYYVTRFFIGAKSFVVKTENNNHNLWKVSRYVPKRLKDLNSIFSRNKWMDYINKQIRWMIRLVTSLSIRAARRINTDWRWEPQQKKKIFPFFTLSALLVKVASTD